MLQVEDLVTKEPVNVPQTWINIAAGGIFSGQTPELFYLSLMGKIAPFCVVIFRNITPVLNKGLM